MSSTLQAPAPHLQHSQAQLQRSFVPFQKNAKEISKENVKDGKKGNMEVNELLERYHQLLIHETQLLQQLQSNDNCSVMDLKSVGLELHKIVFQKINELRTLVGEHEDIQIKETPQASPVTMVERNYVIHVVEQPTGNVVANKYLEPPVIVRVDDSLLDLASGAKLQMIASLGLSLSDETLSRTLDNKQDILQGNTIVQVSSEGIATFNKLKIMEVSSKHHHQAFSIQIQLQEQSSGEVISVGEPIKLAPLHVQSRINKRTRASTFTTNGRPKKRTRGEAESNYVDITPLLVLPQKEAANRLGISESMLCKRFKECTRRKWPYRYLRKIDKMIRVLTLNKKPESIPKDDQDKIQCLKKEREECLHPVKIRITGHDKTTRTYSPSPSKSSKPSTDDSESASESNSGSPYEEEEEEEKEVEVEEDEIEKVASTLNLLKKGGF